jgi:hypothetical protein
VVDENVEDQYVMTRIIQFLFYLLPTAYCLLFFSSCKPSLPVYFDKPIGTKVQGFDTTIAGDYILLEDVLDKGTKDFSAKYTVKYDKIVPKDTGVSIEENGKDLNYEDVKNIIRVKKDSGKIELNTRNCDSIFHSFCSFNEMSSDKMYSGINKDGREKNTITGVIKITYDRIFVISIDSAGKSYTDTLLSLGSSVLLTQCSGKYFLNFKTQYGWEIMQLDVWENKFLSARPFYFTSYDNCSKTAAELTASTKNIYPNLKPLLNAEKKVIGFKAHLDEKVIMEKFKKSEQSVLLLKIK